MEEVEMQTEEIEAVGECAEVEGGAASDTEGIKISDNPSEDNEDGSEVGIDYAALAAEDLKALRSEFRELSGLTDICELDNPLRYAALRDLGLTPAEAYLATAKRQKKDNRSHLYATRTVTAAPQGSMSEAEMAAAREIFSGVSDAEIRKLYKRVSAK